MAVLFAGAQAQYNDPNVEKRTVGTFHGIDVATGVELVLMEGAAEEVAVSAATAEFRDRIVTKVENGILKIHYETKTGAINKTTNGLNAWTKDCTFINFFPLVKQRLAICHIPHVSHAAGKV